MSWLWSSDNREEEVVEEVVEEPQTPQYVTKEEYMQTQNILQSLQQSMQTLSTGFNAVAADRQQRQAPADIEDVTDDELEEALQLGKGAEKFRKMVNAGVERVKREVLGPELTAGFAAITGLTKEVVASKMPYYTRFQKEIDEYIGALGPQQQLQPASYKAAHDYVVGLHVTELLAEQGETTRRQGNPPPQGGQQGGANSRTTGAGRGQPESFQFSADNQGALAVKGYTPDQQAQRMGYKGWSDYMDKTKDIEL